MEQNVHVYKIYRIQYHYRARETEDREEQEGKERGRRTAMCLSTGTWQAIPEAQRVIIVVWCLGTAVARADDAQQHVHAQVAGGLCLAR